MNTAEEILEYWFTVGMNNGLSVEDAVDYADEQFKNG